MIPYVILPVQPVLRDWVESIFIMDVDFVQKELPSVYSYPWSVTTHLYFTLRGSPLRVMSDKRNGYINYSENFTVGPRLVNYMVDLGEYRYVAGIAFRPCGLHRLFGIPLTEIIEGLDLELVFTSEIKQISEQIVNATSNQEVFFFLEQFLLNRLASLKPLTAFDQAVAELVKHNGNVPISKVSDWAGISIRQFERRSYNSLGVPPKLFAQITRFSNACLYKESNARTTWSQLAYMFGYTDQTHLVDDFKRFAGDTPARLSDQINLKLLTGIEGRLHTQ